MLMRQYVVPAFILVLVPVVAHLIKLPLLDPNKIKDSDKVRLNNVVIIKLN